MKTAFSFKYSFPAVFGLLVALAGAFIVMEEQGVSETVNDWSDESSEPLPEKPLEVPSSERSRTTAFDNSRMTEKNPKPPIDGQEAVTRTEPNSMDHKKLTETFGSKEEVAQMRQSFSETIDEKGLMNSDRGVGGYLEQVFKEEPVDGLWAYDYETALYEVFANDEILSGKPIKSIECRSVRCRIDVQIKSPEAMMEVYKRLQTAVIQEEGGLNYAMFLGQYSINDGIATWYLGRDRTVDLLGDGGNP